MSWLRQPLLAIAGSERIRQLVTAVPLSSGIVANYVPGESTYLAVATADRLIEQGLRVTINCLGEDATDSTRVAETTEAYLALLNELSQRGLAHQAELSIKLSALGLVIDQASSDELALSNARTIAVAAHQAGTMLTLDMEQHSHIDAALMVLGELRKDFPDTGVALQAYLHRTEADCRALSFEGSRVRLCKGAYAEREDVAFQSRINVDRSFVRCLKVLLSGQGYPMIASHDPRMIQIALSLASRYGRARGSYEFQFLYGVRPDEQLRLAKSGETTRVYVPYGPQWFGYLMRRVAERPENMSFVLKSLISKK